MNLRPDNVSLRSSCQALCQNASIREANKKAKAVDIGKPVLKGCGILTSVDNAYILDLGKPMTAALQICIDAQIIFSNLLKISLKPTKADHKLQERVSLVQWLECQARIWEIQIQIPRLLWRLTECPSASNTFST